MAGLTGTLANVADFLGINPSASKNDTAPNKAILKVNGKTFEGWKKFSISRSVETLCASFSLEVTDKWGDSAPWGIQNGDACELLIDDSRLITGYVDAVAISLTASSRQIRISGRDKTQDVVDCAVIVTNSQLIGNDLTKMAKAICAPFGIKVSALTSVGESFPNYGVQAGETGQEILDKLARQRGVLLYTDPDGTLLISAPGGVKANTALIEGQNILAASSDVSTKDRFSDYLVTSSFANVDDETPPETTNLIKGTAKDAGVKRYRPTWIKNEQQSATGGAIKRAQFEAIVRAAKGEKYSVTVPGFRQADGSLWPINALVKVRCPLLNLDSELLIAAVTYAQDESSGSITTLELKRKDAFKTEPVVKDNLAQLVKETSR